MESRGHTVTHVSTDVLSSGAALTRSTLANIDFSSTTGKIRFHVTTSLSTVLDPFGCVGWAFLSALVHKREARIGHVGVHEVPEPLELLLIFNRGSPFTLVRL